MHPIINGVLRPLPFPQSNYYEPFLVDDRSNHVLNERILPEPVLVPEGRTYWAEKILALAFQIAWGLPSTLWLPHAGHDSDSELSTSLVTKNRRHRWIGTGSWPPQDVSESLSVPLTRHWHWKKFNEGEISPSSSPSYATTDYFTSLLFCTLEK